MNSVLSGRGTTIFIYGEAGSGNTRFITEFLKIAKKKDVTVLTGWCLSEAAIPYFPFVEAFDSYLSTNEDEAAIGVHQKLGLNSWLLETNQFEASENLANMQSHV